MRALVTGGAGFIGSSIADRLVQEGWAVRVLDNLSTGNREYVPDGVEFLEGDLRNEADAKSACAEIDVVFHQAAVRSVPRSLDEPRLVNESNITGTLNLLLAAHEAAVNRFVYASSSSVYGDVGAAINREDLPTDPQSPYAVSKLAGEMYCRVWTALGRVDTVSLRYFNVFGPRQHPDSKYAAVFPGFISALITGRAPEVHWDGEQSRDFTFIDDVVDANLKAATAPASAAGGVYNVGSGQPKTVNETLQSIADYLGTWIEPTRTEKRGGDIRRTHADISRAKSDLGWKPQVEWERAVAATVDWFKK